MGHADGVNLISAILSDRLGRQVCRRTINGSHMALRILRLSALLALSPSDRLKAVQATAREIEKEIEHLKASRSRIWYGRSANSRQYRLQSLYARRQRLKALAREAGCGDWIREPAEVACRLQGSWPGQVPALPSSR